MPVLHLSKSRHSPPSSSKSFIPSSPARSLDDDDVPTSEYAASFYVVHDPHAVKLCADVLTMLEQLKTLAEGRDDSVTRFAEEKPGADIYELTLDRVRGSLSVKCVQEIAEGLDAAAREARERLAHEIAKRKQDIAGLEKEGDVLLLKIQQSKGEGMELVLQQLGSVHAMIGRHKEILKELESKSEVEAKVKVQRVSTCVELTKETSIPEQEVRLVPTRDAGIYVLGGTPDQSAVLSSVERYDVVRNKWEAVEPMNNKRSGAGSAVLGGKIFAVGGWGGKSLNSVECFSPKSGRWEEIAPLATARQGCTVAALYGRLFVAGGHDGQAFLSSAISFDAEANEHTELAPMINRRCYAAGAVLDGYFFAMGGRDGEERLRTVERYDPASNVWELVASMNSKRSGCAAAVCNGYLFAFGGSDSEGSHLSSMERFDPKLNKWEEVAPMQSKRSCPAAAVVDGCIYAIGGFLDTTYLSSVERYDPDTNSWEYAAPMSTVRFKPTAAVAV